MSLQGMLGRGGPVAALLVGALAFAASAASASPASDAGGWLAEKLDESTHTHYEVVFGEETFDDPGLTADGLLAFEATGATAPAAATAGWLTSGEYPDAYVGDGETTSYAGSLGKLGAALAAHGLDPNNPTKTGGRTLMTDLVALQKGNGRFKDIPVDFSNPFGQSWATLALAACDRSTCASVPPGTAEAVENSAAYLRSEQCLNGGFPSQFEEEGGCVSDVDSTGMAVQALLTEASGASEAAAETAVAWLEEAKSEEGDFWVSNACEPPGPSANSTVLAMMGLSAWGTTVSGPSAWLESIQNHEATDAGLPRCSASGPGNVRATVQGVYGLSGSSHDSYMKQLGLP